jgi:NAD(P)-dependent dehydrogenase (short-subunit alcohol dehydrogenase family)
MLTPTASLLTDKVAIVTGGGGGIGKAISQAYAAYGARVVVAEIDGARADETAREIRDEGGEALAVITDVRVREQVAAMTDATYARYGRVDILVNNVGDFLQISKPILESTEDEWQRLYDINLRHIFLCCQAVVPRMVEAGWGGSVINFSTIEAFRGIPHLAAYSAFKGAITQFTKSFALDMGPHRIRVNAIAPEKTQSIQMWSEDSVTDEQRRQIPHWVPIGRLGTGDDMAGIAVFLASDMSQYVTGTTIHADGGCLAAGGLYRDKTGRWGSTPAGLT